MRSYAFKNDPELSGIIMEINDLGEFNRVAICPQTGHVVVFHH
jgi:hypothetical protein